MHRDPTSLTLLELGRAYRSGILDPLAATEAYLAKIEHDPRGALVYRTLCPARALQQARRARQMFAGGVDAGPLQGVPLAIKDLLDMQGEVSAAGSRVLLEGAPASEDAPVTARLDALGAVFLGRTTMTELAFSGVGINPHFGTPGSAHDAARVPGGSSSGSAVAVACGLAAAAVGSDTGGSVRIPASINGIVGLKTTDGRIPTEGAVPLSTTLDTLGPMARDADDAWALFLAMAAEPWRELAEPAPRLAVMAPTTVLREGLEPEVGRVFAEVLGRLAASGMDVREGALPVLGEIPEMYRRYGSFASHEAFALYEELLTRRGRDMDPRVTARVLEYGGRPSADYIRLGFARRDVRRRFWPELTGVDAVLAPTIPIVAPRIAELAADDAYFRANALLLRNTSIFNVIGCPALSVPGGRTAEGLPVGVMIATRPGEEELALGIGRAVMSAAR